MTFLASSIYHPISQDSDVSLHSCLTTLLPYLQLQSSLLQHECMLYNCFSRPGMTVLLSVSCWWAMSRAHWSLSEVTNQCSMPTTLCMWSGQMWSGYLPIAGCIWCGKHGMKNSSLIIAKQSVKPVECHRAICITVINNMNKVHSRSVLHHK